MFFQRTLSKKVLEASASFKVVLINGPRQVGKTTLFAKLFANLKEKNRTFVSLDDIMACSLAQNDPALFFQTYKPPILIDEIQKAPQLFPYIKMMVDKSDDRGQFWLTGSQQFHLMKGVSESLAGRIAILDLQGFSQSEKFEMPIQTPFLPSFGLKSEKIFNLEQVFDLVFKGSFPQLFDGITKDINLFYSSYVRTYIERDVREITKISDENAFVKFLKLIAVRTAQELNYYNLAKEVGVSANTIKSWISILNTSNLIHLLPPYFNNLGKRIVKSPKLYFLDTGLCCYLSGISFSENAKNSQINGALFENYVVSEILKSYWHNGIRPAIYFYRDVSQKEIDLIIESNGKSYPIEIKQTCTPTLSMTSNFALIDPMKRGTGAVVCLSDKLIPLNNETIVVPVGCI